MTAVEPVGRRPRRAHRRRAIGVYAFLVSAALFFLLPLWIMVVTSLKPMDEVRLGNILAWPSEPTLRALGHGLVQGLHRARVQRHQRRLLELGADPDPVRDPLDRRRCDQRLRPVLLAGARGQLDVRHPARRRLHPLPGLPLSPGPHLLAGRHLQLADLHRARPRHLRPADDDAALPQLLRLAAGRAVQGGPRRWRRLLDDLLPA